MRLKQSEPEMSASDNLTVLALETAVEAGSAALFINGTVADGFVCAAGAAARSVDLLDEIGKMLEKNAVEKRRIKLIAVSRGPGSFTGARVGAALGLGLAKSVGCRYIACTVLEAMVFSASANEIPAKEFAAAIPFGKNRVCRQLFSAGSDGGVLQISPPEILTRGDFTAELNNTENAASILHETLYKDLAVHTVREGKPERMIINAGANLSILIGRKALSAAASGYKLKAEDDAREISPLYIGSF